MEEKMRILEGLFIRYKRSKRSTVNTVINTVESATMLLIFISRRYTGWTKDVSHLRIIVYSY